MMLEYYLLLPLLLLLSRIPHPQEHCRTYPSQSNNGGSFCNNGEAVVIVLAEFSVEGLTASHDLLIHCWWLFSHRCRCYRSWRAARWANSS